MDNSLLFFIVGRGRSGTTLLQTILNVHPQLSVAREGQFVLLLMRKYEKKKWQSEKIKNFIDDLWRESRLEDWELDREQLNNDLLLLGENSNFAELCKIVYANYGKARGKFKVRALGDKNPIYSLFITDLVRLYPDAKFIHIIRDYRDNILSYKSVKFDLNCTTALAYRWKKYNQEILKFSQKYPDKFLAVHFEDLVREPNVQLPRICAFLDVDYVSDMLDFFKYEQYQPKRDWHQNLAQPLDPSLLFKWRHKMSELDIKKADFICRDLAEYFEYEHKVNKSFLFSLQLFPGVLYGWLFTLLERFVFLFPTQISARIIYVYRVFTGSFSYLRQKDGQ